MISLSRTRNDTGDRDRDDPVPFLDPAASAGSGRDSPDDGFLDGSSPIACKPFKGTVVR